MHAAFLTTYLSLCILHSKHHLLPCCRTPCLEELLIVLHTIHASANTKQALSTRQRISTPAATALHTPSTIHNQLAQLQDQPQSALTPAFPSRQNSHQEASSHARRDTNSFASSSSTTAPTPLSRSGLQTVERLSAASSLRQRQSTPEASASPVPSHQDSQLTQKQTQYRNPVFGQVSLLFEPLCILLRQVRDPPHGVT